mmetsp:Transcript_100484/g.299810  ORF Transcript_100484/g.299810 Transcript_100484/m.299810 type:complete len:510 (-) Transcript_100484:132-1661(-)
MALRSLPPSRGGGGSTVALSGKLQLAQSPSFHGSPPGDLAQPLLNGTQSIRFSVRNGFGSPAARFSNKGPRRSRSSGSIEIAEVRALSGDAPLKGDSEVPRSQHDNLLLRLKSRAARQEAENNRAFLALYRSESVTSQATEARLDALLKSTAQHAEELKQRSEDLQSEATEVERRLERTNAQNVERATEAELMTLNAFERSQRRIQEDKKEEDLQRQRDEVQANYAKVHRKLQSELIELRDYKVLLREFKRVRLEKLYDTLGRVSNGRNLRACVREMIRHGAQRIVQKLESSPLPLEPWMREVLVNCCHVEMRIEDVEARLLSLRRQALQPVKEDVEAMLSQTKQQRFETLCTRTWESRTLTLREEAANNRRSSVAAAPGDHGGDAPEGTGATGLNDTLVGNADLGATAAAGGARATGSKAVPDKVVADMRAAEADIAALRRLLADMRHNTAAVIINQIRQAEKNGGKMAGLEATGWGTHILSLLFSEDFAKATMKEMQKSAPSAKFTQ